VNRAVLKRGLRKFVVAVFFKKISASLSKIIPTNRCDICHVRTAEKKDVCFTNWSGHRIKMNQMAFCQATHATFVFGYLLVVLKWSIDVRSAPHAISDDKMLDVWGFVRKYKKDY